jgi:hypothetical protein
VSFLGADTPGEALLGAAARVGPDVVVLFARDRGQIDAIRAELEEVASRSKLLLAGDGVDPELSEMLGASLLRDGPVEAAKAVAA